MPGGGELGVFKLPGRTGDGGGGGTSNPGGKLERIYGTLFLIPLLWATLEHSVLASILLTDETSRGREGSRLLLYKNVVPWLQSNTTHATTPIKLVA